MQKRSGKLVPVHDNLARFFALVSRLPFSPVSPCIPVTYRNHGRIPGPLFVPVYRCTRAAATRPATAGQVIRTHGPCSSTFYSCPVSGGPGEAASYVESYNFSTLLFVHIHLKELRSFICNFSPYEKQNFFSLSRKRFIVFF